MIDLLRLFNDFKDKRRQRKTLMEPDRDAEVLKLKERFVQAKAELDRLSKEGMSDKRPAIKDAVNSEYQGLPKDKKRLFLNGLISENLLPKEICKVLTVFEQGRLIKVIP